MMQLCVFLFCLLGGSSEEARPELQRFILPTPHSPTCGEDNSCTAEMVVRVGDIPSMVSAAFARLHLLGSAQEQVLLDAIMSHLPYSGGSERPLTLSYGGGHNRTTTLKHFQRKYALDGAYLEIGCAWNQNFHLMTGFETTIGVDPLMGGTHRMTSDEFFQENDVTFDLALVDGLHTFEQSLRDAENALRALAPGGLVLLHDVNPLSEGMSIPTAPPEHVRRHNGDAYKTVIALRQRPDLDVAVGDFDEGVGVVIKRPATGRPAPELDMDSIRQLEYAEFAERRGEFLNLLPWDQLSRWVDIGRCSEGPNDGRPTLACPFV